MPKKGHTEEQIVAVLRQPNVHRAKIRSSKSADGRMAAEADEFPGRPLDNQKQIQNRLDTDRPFRGRTWPN
jgi:hypothetical protein